MKPDQQTEYIVQCIRESGAMYEDDARQFLAEHDNRVRAEAIAEVEALLATMTTEADQQTEAMENEGADSASLMYAQYAGLRRARDAARRMTGEKATPTGATATPEAGDGRG